MNYFYGYPTYWDETAQLWRYSDNDEPAVHPSNRPCPKCSELPTPEGHDACLGEIPGVCGACCGHGVEMGYIAWDCDGKGIMEQAWEVKAFGRTFKFSMITEIEADSGFALSDPR